MTIRLNDLKKGCPEEIQKDMGEIVALSRDFFENIDLYAHQDLEEAKIDVQEAKDLLFQMISRFVTIISNQLKPTESKVDEGYRQKFSEDMGGIIYGLRERGFGSIDKLVGFNKVLGFAGELKTLYDFTIYNPITVANKTPSKNIDEYLLKIFKTVRVNASILASAEKLPGAIATSRMMLQKPQSLIASGEGEKPKKGKAGPTGPSIDFAEDLVIGEDLDEGIEEGEIDEDIERA